MLCHKIDRIRCGHLARYHEVAFILTIFMVNKNKHLAVSGVFDDLLDRRDHVAIGVLDLARSFIIHGYAPALWPCFSGFKKI